MPSGSPARAKNFSTLQSACLEPNNQVCDASKVQSDNSFGMLNRQQENEEYEENAGSCCCDGRCNHWNSCVLPGGYSKRGDIYRGHRQTLCRLPGSAESKTTRRWVFNDGIPIGIG